MEDDPTSVGADHCHSEWCKHVITPLLLPQIVVSRKEILGFVLSRLVQISHNISLYLSFIRLDDLIIQIPVVIDDLFIQYCT